MMGQSHPAFTLINLVGRRIAAFYQSQPGYIRWALKMTEATSSRTGFELSAAAIRWGDAHWAIALLDLDHVRIATSYPTSEHICPERFLRPILPNERSPPQLCDGGKHAESSRCSTPGMGQHFGLRGVPQLALKSKFTIQVRTGARRTQTFPSGKQAPRPASGWRQLLPQMRQQ